MKNSPQQPGAKSIRTQILLAVNLPLSVVLVGLLALQYDREMTEAVTLKQAGLDDQAIAVRAAATHLLQEHGTGDVQNYIDSVCTEMRNSWSPKHHISVRLRSDVLHAAEDDPDPDALYSAIRASIGNGQRQTQYREEIVVAGVSSSDGIDVFVSESLTNIRRSIRREVLTQVAVLGVLGLLAAVIVNVVVLRTIRSPIRRLLQTVKQLTDGDLGVETRLSGSREMQELCAAITAMSVSLKQHDSERRAQMARARDIQQHLLPNGMQIPGLQTAHLFEPADEVAGDYYDFLPLRDGSWLICLADVTGHGVPAAMGAAMLKMLLLNSAEESPLDPTAILRKINKRFTASIMPGNFATMFLARWHPKRGELCWTSAGHESAILFAASGAADQLRSSGLPLGIELDADWALQTTKLEEGDRLLIYSDGATETHGANGGLFGRERLVSWYSKHVQDSSRDALSSLSSVLRDFRGDHPRADDLTLVELRCGTSSEVVNDQPTDLLRPAASPE